MKKKIYDALAWSARYLLPALAALWAAVSRLWGLPLGQEVTGTLAALAVFVNALLGLDSTAFWQEHEIRPLGEERDDAHSPS